MNKYSSFRFLCGQVVLIAVFCIHSLGAPTNDNFTSSVQLSGTNISYAGDVTGATLEPNEPAGGGTNTVWMSWSPPGSGAVITTLPHWSQKHAWAIYTGSSVDNLQPVSVVPLYANSLCRFWAAEGTVYHFQFAGEAASSFTFDFQFQAAGVCSNDNFADAELVRGRSLTLGPSPVAGATMELGEPAHMGDVPQQSIWWKWQAPQNGTYLINPNSMLVTNLVLAVYSGESVEALTLIAKSTNSEVRFPVTGGRFYYIAGAVPTNSPGDIRGHLQYAKIDNSSRAVPGNCLLEPSWEESLEPEHWGRSGSIGGWWGAMNLAADGFSWPTLSQGAKIWQDFSVTPGHEYAVQFAFQRSGAQVKVSWDTNVLGIASIPAGEPEFWNWVTYKTVPSNSTARITFENLGGSPSGGVDMDAFSVVDLSAPPKIINQPSSISTVSGGTAPFVVGISGSSPLNLQWFHNDQSLMHQTNRFLVLSSVSTNETGGYFVIITNGFGAVTSVVASLLVDASAAPSIVWQPYGDTVAEGGYYNFSVAAIGTPPLVYQWFFNGAAVANATQKTLTFTNVQASDAGIYHVTVSNSAGVVWSLPAKLVVSEAINGGGLIDFRNQFVTTVTNKFPVFDLDGITPLNGNEFRAQLYAGPALELLRPAGQPTPFRTDFDAGYFVPQLVSLANVPPGSNCVVQVRAWEFDKGNSYEEARALGGKFGKSEILTITAGGDTEPPGFLLGLQSFGLEAGLPYLTVGILQFSERLPDGTVVWSLTGEPGFRYVVERAVEDFLWQPLLVVTNVSGTVTFTDSSTATQPSCSIEHGFWIKRVCGS